MSGFEGVELNAPRARAAERAWVDSESEKSSQPPIASGESQELFMSSIDGKAEAKMEVQAELDALNAKVEEAKQQVALATAQRAMIATELRPLLTMLNDPKAGNSATQTAEMIAKMKPLQTSLAEVQRAINTGNESLLKIQALQKAKQAQFNMAFPAVTQ